jgi:hypothetical protein
MVSQLGMESDMQDLRVTKAPSEAPNHEALEAHRDRLAERIVDGEQKITALLPDDPRESSLMDRWHGLELAYRHAVCQMPEAPSTACLDCGELSPNGMTPCDRCIAEEAEAAA